MVLIMYTMPWIGLSDMISIIPRLPDVFNVCETEGSLGHKIVRLKLPHSIVTTAVIYVQLYGVTRLMI